MILGQERNKLPPFMLMEEHLVAQATDLRNKIFALATLPDDFLANFVDYIKSRDEVLILIARLGLEQKIRPFPAILDLLPFAGVASRSSNLPSFLTRNTPAMLGLPSCLILSQTRGGIVSEHPSLAFISDHVSQAGNFQALQKLVHTLQG